ncbi:NADPH-dependent FMN reductase [Chelatococcus sambhunathii]|uniref:NADPH-dependent FMN reductase n=1 Tax=Chelatococcus sambhunathii TaxID=363953 RepID=A0ABU1DI02_9HYPH|nr:NADPH-dependent FMN reductase [Chelatococcus sambhunathii]MDR4307719.1 NADPH-dependent FMN reductase [Chelatococcus sambhunathii]
MTSVLFVSGSPAPTSKSARLAEHVRARLDAAGFSTAHVRVRDLPAEPLLAGDASEPAIADAVAALDKADGVVFVTPTYKASYSGLIKTFLDLLPQRALTDKAVLPLAVGGSLAHVLMLDYALRPVLHSLGVRHSVQGCFLIESALDATSEEFVVGDLQRDMLDRAIGNFTRALTDPAATQAA